MAVQAGDIPRERCGEAGDTRLNLRKLAAAGDSFDPDSARASGVSGLVWGNRDEGALDDAIHSGDDRAHHRAKWENAGGTFVTHKNAERSLAALRTIFSSIVD